MDDPIELVFGGYWQLKDIEPGSLFLCNDGKTICVMSEYTTNERAIAGLPYESYIVGSGEFCCVKPDEWVILLNVQQSKAVEFPKPLKEAEDK